MESLPAGRPEDPEAGHRRGKQDLRRRVRPPAGLPLHPGPHAAGDHERPERRPVPAVLLPVRGHGAEPSLRHQAPHVLVVAQRSSQAKSLPS